MRHPVYRYPTPPTPTPSPSPPPGWIHQKLKLPTLPLRNTSKYLWYKFQPDRTMLKGSCLWHNRATRMKNRFLRKMRNKFRISLNSFKHFYAQLFKGNSLNALKSFFEIFFMIVSYGHLILIERRDWMMVSKGWSKDQHMIYLRRI